MVRDEVILVAEEHERSAAARTLAEIMRQYNENRKKWISQFGSAEGFDTWFTGQVF